ncbi:glycosyltransferase family 4 protein [Bradyrhizobium symbiodeficiens]|uniref:glycosyltransferase family 4 protein n=1 Tax=Bradyrhizobium symbiodeficiens TaxID=1404367 RepID=UPI00140F4FC2|nr:glycosyltransferase family 1 protein [Bradyrhizobium symbiodeficiens]QIO98795.1 glycosyltransferase family 4 protein [Bradyrhizobium symbiodeficiens]
MSHSARILLVGNYAPDRQFSMLRYTSWLAAALRRQGFEVDLIAPSVRLARLASGQGPVRKWLGFVDKFLLFAAELKVRASRYDLVHIADHSNAPYVLLLGSTPSSITCHDLIPIKVLSGEVEGQRLPSTGRYLQRLIRLSLHHVANIAFVSAPTQADFTRLIGHPAGTSDVIPNPVIGFGGMDQDRALELLRQADLPVDRPFLLHVGSNIWYKNRRGAVELFGLLRDHPEWEPSLRDALMVCVGPPLPEDATRIASNWQRNLIVLSEASNELIEALYMQAEALLYPSYEEGFGWPIIEAQACGCPVITTDKEPMRSIAGPAALLIDPHQPQRSAASIARNWAWLTSQSEAARSHAGSFSEDVAAARYAAFLVKVLAERKDRMP